jgi:hypothetical protein
VVSSVANNLAPEVLFEGDRLKVHFERFDIAAYGLFLKFKRLPESHVTFDDILERYSIDVPRRYARMLDVALPPLPKPDLPLSAFLFDDQDAIVRMALDAKRFAVWSDCGLGKTLIELEFARHVIHRTGGRVLLITMNEIVGQIIDEAAAFYEHTLPIYRIKDRADLKRWCKEGGPGLAITNYEKMNPDADGLDVPEMRYLAGLILDESSRLKTGGGKQKWALIHSSKGIEYKLSCTATPAPNDAMEFASQASFLETMRSEGEILWTYFDRDDKTHRWTVKPHARAAFFDFMSSWSIYVRDPRKYGWRKDHKPVPDPVIFTHEIMQTVEQLEASRRYCTEPSGQRLLLRKEEVNAIERAKLSQIAKGFAYRKGEKGAFERIRSLKPGFVADLIQSEVRSGLQVLTWTVFDAESSILAEELSRRGVGFELLTGATKDRDRARILSDFKAGRSRVLIGRASMLGYGQNLQMVGSMIFNGWNDSYEAYYQAIRRAVRHGQTERVRVHLPVVRDLEGDMLDNLYCKEAKHLAAIAEMESLYIRTMQSWGMVA